MESYDGNPGDQVVIDCFVSNGDTVASYAKGNPASSYWYQVEVPADWATDPTSHKLFDRFLPQGSQVTRDRQPVILGFANTQYFGSVTPDPRIPEC